MKWCFCSSWASYLNSEWCQDVSVNCSCFAKTKWTQHLFDPCACTSQDEYCTTELCLSVDKLTKKKQQRTQRQGRDCVNVQMSTSMKCTICHMLKLKELTPLLNCRRLLKAVSCHHRSFSFVPPSAISTFVPPAISRKRSPKFFASALVRNPSRCFVKRSAVLFFVSTRLTERRFCRIHCCIAKHRKSRSVTPPGPLRCRMCLAESESIARRTEASWWSSLKSSASPNNSPAQALAWLRRTLLHKNWDWLQSASDFGCTLLRSVHRNDIP